MKVYLANPRGFCAGVDRAIETVEQALLRFGAPVYVRHWVVHNTHVVQKLEQRGAIFVEELSEVPDQSIVVLSAHGVSLAVQQEAKRRCLQIFDATCPLVTKVHMEVARLSRMSEECVLIGHANHPEVIGTLGHYQNLEAGIYLVEDIEQAKALQVKDPHHLSYVTQTTLSVDETKSIIAVLQERFPEITGPKRDDICYATQNRQEAVRNLARLSEVVLVVGSPSSSNSNRLRELAEQLGAKAYLIDDLHQIQTSWLLGKKAVGVTAGASAPEAIVQSLIHYLKKEWMAEVVTEVQGIEENMHFPLAKELRSNQYILRRGVPLFNSTQIKALEQKLFAEGTTPQQLMQQAGQAGFEVLQEYFPEARSITVLCGPGKNGRNGIELALSAQKAGLQVTIYRLISTTTTSTIAFSKELEEACVAAGLTLEHYQQQPLEGDVLVDAVFGMGLSGKPEGLYAQVMVAMQSSGIPILSMDIPSGVHSETGATLAIGVQARVTVTFIGLKKGLYTGNAVDHSGEIVLKTLGAEQYYRSIEGNCFLVDPETVPLLEARKQNSHKGSYGYVSVVGGDIGFGGAALLSASAALFTGAGRVGVLTHPVYQTAFLGTRPELMVTGVDTGEVCVHSLSDATVLVVGPGLSQSPWSTALWRCLEDVNIPAVVDAGALQFLVGSPQSRETWILTPHPKEAARLLGMTVQAVLEDRFSAILKLQKRYGGVIVLKGAGTLITDGYTLWVCKVGNPGMATAGSGDVLAGIIGGLLAQGLSLVEAALRGVWIHAKAGDSAAETGLRGLTAQDIVQHIRRHNQS